MRYELYIDSLIFTNFVMNLYLLFLVNASTLRTATPGRLFGGAAVGAVGFLLPFLGGGTSGFRFAVGALLGTVGMLCLTFSVKSVKMLLKLLEKLLIFSFALGGGLLFLIKAFPQIRQILTDVLALLGLGGMLVWMIYRVRFDASKSSICKATLIKGPERIKLLALIDSGNSLVEPISGKPVCVVDREVLSDSSIPELTHFRAIPYHSVGKKSGVLPGYLLPLLRVEADGMVYEFKDVYIAVSEETVKDGGDVSEKSVKMIMNPCLFLERGCRKTAE